MIQGLTQGLVQGHTSGLNPGGTIWDLLTDGAALASAMSFANAPNLGMWKGSDLSGAADLENSNDLSDVSSPTKSVSDSTLGATCTQFSDNSAQSMDAPSSSVGDIGTAISSAWLFIGRLTTTPSASLSLIDKRNGGEGFVMYTNASGHAVFTADTSAQAPVAYTVSLDHTSTYIAVLWVDDRNASSSDIYSNLGTGTSRGARSGTMTNAELLSIGQGSSNNAAPVNFALAAGWSGTSAEGLTRTHLTNLLTYLGLSYTP